VCSSDLRTGAGGIGANSAVFPGGSWYAVNGWLTWALGTLGGVVPNAADYALSELEGNTLAAHANAYPQHWDGITSVDDVCSAFYSPAPANCGASLTTAYAGQIMHQPTWSLFDAIRLAGITPTAGGYQIRPGLPLRTFSVGLPRIGVSYSRAGAKGYVFIARAETLTMAVAPPSAGSWRVLANGRPTSTKLRNGLLTFALPARPGRAATWRIAG